MAQLSDDCFAFGGPLLSVDDALALLSARLSTVCDVETAGLMGAVGRVLAEAIVAPIDVPPFANSAVDGYAVRFADLRPGQDTLLPIVGRVAAGHGPGEPPTRPVAVRIFTGAPMPTGFDTVMMQEDAKLDDDGHVVLRPGLKRGANARPAGEDVARGSVALPVGRRLRPQDVGLAASLGLDRVPVRRRLRVGVFSTGDEVCAPGGPLRAHALYDSNRFTLSALLARLGCEVADLGILPDRQEALAAALRIAAPGVDLLLTSGGVSTGEEDHVKAAVEAVGRLHLWRVGIKPGRPVAFGQIDHADGRCVFIGLPGNPVAVMVTFAILVRPMIAALSGAEPERVMRIPARSDFVYRKKAGRREYVRVTLVPDSGGLSAHKAGAEGAGILSSMVAADGLAELPETLETLTPGDHVAVLPFSAIL